MKKIILLIILIILSNQSLVYANENKKEDDILDEISKKDGLLLIREIIEGKKKLLLPYNKMISFNNIIIQMPSEKITVKEIQIIISSQYSKDIEDSTYIDIEEIEPLLKAINYIEKTSQEWEDISKNDTEITFKTKKKFVIGLQQKDKEQTFFAHIDNMPKIKILSKNVNFLKQLASELQNNRELLKK